MNLKLTHPNKNKAREAVCNAKAYLQSCGIFVPHFELEIKSSDQFLEIGGSYVRQEYGDTQLSMGCYPTSFLRNWFAMHEIGHVLWGGHHPLRWKRFRLEFGKPRPTDEASKEIHKKYSWRTAGSRGIHRPNGEPSYYGKLGGGEERFCELIAYMYACGDFSKNPPSDLVALWECCWEHGLSRMI